MAEEKENLPMLLIGELSRKRWDNEGIKISYETISKIPELFKFEHEVIAKRIYELEEEKAEILEYNTGLMLQLTGNSHNFLDKLLHAIKLSVVQRAYFLSQVESAKFELAKAQESIEEVAQSVSDLDQTSNQIKQQVEYIKDTKSSIYSDLVAVLGIFTAITFALFGGTSLLGSMFESISNPTPTKLGYSFIIGGIYFLSLYGLIAVLFTGMYRVMKGEKYTFHKGVTRIVILFGISIMLVGLVVILLNK